jgi:hypothetical protein
MKPSSIAIIGIVTAGVCVLFGGCGIDETMHRADKPLSFESARKDPWISSLPFPPSSKDIYYLYHAGGMQEFEFAVRFSVETKDLDEAVKTLLSYHDRVSKRQNAYVSVPIADAPAPPSFVEFKPMPWWQPTSISVGYYRGGDTKSQPFGIWVDAARSTIYLAETD